jgi:heterodisulfide reductase subunit B
MMQYSYFPGCSMDTTAITYKKSIEYVCAKIGLVLREIPDWNCCGATCAHSKNEKVALSLPARNLALAEEEGLGLDVAVPCASCYSRMKHTVHAARKSDEVRQEIEEIIGMPYKAQADVLNFLEIFAKPEMLNKCKEQMYRNLKGMKVACYYGCLTSRPVEVTGSSSTENPMEMDEIVKLTGAIPVDWGFKTECCGASHHVDAPNVARPQLDRILRNAQANGAQAIVTACPLCNLNLDMREGELNKANGTKYNLPIYQFTELLAVCMGAGVKDLGLNKHFFPAFDLLNDYLRKGVE